VNEAASEGNQTPEPVSWEQVLQLLEAGAPRARALLLQHGLPLPNPHASLAARKLARRLARLEQRFTKLAQGTPESQSNTRKKADDEANASD
jgi:hypothetical protein